MFNESLAAARDAVIGVSRCVGGLGASLWRGYALVLAFAPHYARAQVITGTVRESATGAAIPYATVIARSDSIVAATGVSDLTGRFSVRVAANSVYRVEVRRIGYAPAEIGAIRVTANTPAHVTATLVRLPAVLDTVSSVARFGGSALTPGRTFVQRHLALKRGIIVAGFDILQSGLPLSEYLGMLDGLKLMPIGAHVPLVPARSAKFLTSDWETKCLYARVDRASLAYLLMSRSRESIDDLLRLDEIKAVEVYRTVHEAPAEWRFEATVPVIFSRTNSGVRYLLGHTGRPMIDGSMLDDDKLRFNSELILDVDKKIAAVTGKQALATRVNGGKVASVAKQGALAPLCGFMQIWTNVAW